MTGDVGAVHPPGRRPGSSRPARVHGGSRRPRTDARRDDARSSRRPDDDDDDDRVDDERGAGVPRWETLEFRAGNPRAEVITGRLRLYRDAVCASVASASSSSSAATTTTTMVTNAPASLPEGRSPMVCVLAVPIELSVADFCQFAAALIPKVTEMRMVQGAPRAIRTGGREDDTREVPTGKPKGRRKAEDASGETSSSVFVDHRRSVVRGDTVVRGPGLRGRVRAQLPQQAVLVTRRGRVPRVVRPSHRARG